MKLKCSQHPSIIQLHMLATCKSPYKLSQHTFALQPMDLRGRNILYQMLVDIKM
jgi:hypothetical protein